MVCLQDLPVVTLPVLVSNETHQLSCAVDFVKEGVNVQYAYQDGQPDHPRAIAKGHELKVKSCINEADN